MSEQNETTLGETPEVMPTLRKALNTSFIRIAVRSLYDQQKIRIQIGNRITAAFRVKLGLEPSQAEEDDKEAKKLLDQIRAEFKRVTDGVKRITKNIKTDSLLITEYSELVLIDAYERQLEAEAQCEKVVNHELEDYAIWSEWLEPEVTGVGTKMAGVIVSEIDIHECNSISALWKYAGLDVVVYEDKEGNVHEEGRSKKENHLVPKTYTNRKGEVTETKGISYNPLLKTKMVGVLGDIFIKSNPHYKAIYDGYKHRLNNHPKHREVWSIVRFETIIDKTKKDKKGKPLKIDKVLETFKVFYDEDEAKLAWKQFKDDTGCDTKTHKLLLSGKTKGHKHKMAVRYMIKEFLADLWTVWRKLEGLPVKGTYAEDVLGIHHHTEPLRNKAA